MIFNPWGSKTKFPFVIGTLALEGTRRQNTLTLFVSDYVNRVYRFLCVTVPAYPF